MKEELGTILRAMTQEELPLEHVTNLVQEIEDDEDLALLLESLPIEDRLRAWPAIAPDRRLNVLLKTRHDPRETILDSLGFEELDALFDGLAADQLIELSETLPNKLVERALRLMDAQQIQYFEKAQTYDPEQIGHWVNQNLLMLPVSGKVRDALRTIKQGVPNYADTLFMINRNGQYHGAVKLSSLFDVQSQQALHELMIEDLPSIHAESDLQSAARQVLQSGFTSLPVVDNTQKLIGRLDVLTANEIIEEAYESKFMAGAGMDEQEDLFAPVAKSIRGRSVWLGINLATALLASWFIGLFEGTLEAVVALAVLMPVVASMGGIAGSQTLALIIRGLALGQVNQDNSKALLDKELRVGAFSGLIWSIVIAIVASLWFDSAMLGLVIALAILVNIVAASVSGLFVPIVLKRLNFDPALSGAVILTTITDIVGFVVFLGLGSLFLL